MNYLFLSQNQNLSKYSNLHLESFKQTVSLILLEILDIKIFAKCIKLYVCICIQVSINTAKTVILCINKKEILDVFLDFNI